MKVLVLQGPNLNLIGVKSAQSGKKITLDKINKAIRFEVRNTKIELKIFQTHKIYMAISFLQRNRNSASGVLLAPMAWAKYEYSLVDTLNLIKLPTVQVIFEGDYGANVTESDSVFSETVVKTVSHHDPTHAFISGLNSLKSYLS
tara:strand:- start:86389 stop:86823 length:435 start_codon:yes stop_codon:yes gene_type:complete